MTRHKTKKFAELLTFNNVLNEPQDIKGNWNKKYFQNENPVVLELGCGKGEYTLALAKEFPGMNFIGVDIKGARLWKGAKNAIEMNLLNVAFLKILIERIEDFFEQGEVTEIWIPFPDPYPKPCKYKKRLVSPRYLCLYRKILKPGGNIHFKTDNEGLYHYAVETLKTENSTILEYTNDLYNSSLQNPYNTIPTYFEGIFKDQGASIKYIRFRL
jgi:tRNA (guanine-N7-)-methyltransferase